MPFAIDDVQQKYIYVVLGMPRSGTSAITRGLKALGIALGDTLTPAHQKFNPKGFWEDKEIVYQINRRVLQAFGMEDNICGLMADELVVNPPDIFALQSQAARLLSQRMTSTRFWGFKDPNTSRIVPFWRQVFEAEKILDQYVIALRNPLSSAHSVIAHTHIDLETALMMWLMHLIPAVDSTAGRNRIVISYELMLQNPRVQLDRIRDTLAFPIVPDEKEIDAYANEFLDNKLKHYTFNDEDMKQHPAVAVMPLCQDVYTILLMVAQDKIKFDSAEFESAWSAIKAAFEKVYPSYQYIQSLHNQNKQLTRRIHKIEKSVPWRLISPLRKLDDILRAYRQRAREKRKLAKSHV
jgi:hypothetical protein